jgi:signal transduction histidine kinase
LESFINAIDTAYKNFESDRKLHENNLDLTSKEITEEIQLANDEAKTKSLFLANRSYEIRTPLSGVLGMLQLLAETNLKAEQLDYLNIASTSALSLLSIINDLLDYYKMEAGVLELEFVEFNFLEWFETTLKIMDVHALNKEQELVGAIITAVPKTLIGDPIRLRQVLINLINNAIKFTEPKGGIIVCVEHLELDGKLLNLSFSVSDSGVGSRR